MYSYNVYYQPICLDNVSVKPLNSKYRDYIIHYTRFMEQILQMTKKFQYSYESLN